VQRLRLELAGAVFLHREENGWERDIALCQLPLESGHAADRSRQQRINRVEVKDLTIL
jgi:hypothetical protein